MEPKFSFPFQPYPIQVRFMKELYLTIEKGNLGIFESPTGTGKSLSICCGALQWLKDTNKNVLEGLQSQISLLKLEISSSTNSADDWLQEEYQKIQKNQTLMALQLKLDKIEKLNQKLNEMKIRVEKLKNNPTNKTLDFYSKTHKDKFTKTADDKDTVGEENNDDEDRDLISEENYEQKEESEDENEEEENDEDILKIYISSRTHSQLSQFIGEMRRTIFKDDTRVVTLASRQHYCINSDVNKLKNVNLINERCLDMQKSKTKPTSVGEDGKVLKKTKTKSCGTCPYYNQANITKLKERMLMDIMDMEDLVKCGKELKACPYYASRMALEYAEVVLVSHAGIVSPGARSGTSLCLQNNILILDEAHGLTHALTSAYAAPVRAGQLSRVVVSLRRYVTRYRAKLGCGSLLAINQLLFVIEKLADMVTPKPNDTQDTATVYKLEEFVIRADIDHLKLQPIIEFCKKTRLAQKLHGFSLRYSQQELEEEAKKLTVSKKSNFESFLSNISKKKVDNKEVVDNKPEDKKPDNNQPAEEVSAGSALYAILDFLSRLAARGAAGRVLCRPHGAAYVLLAPEEHFADVVTQCRSVILAGGTMEPIAEFQELLTGRREPSERVNVVRCDHVVPADNVLAVCLASGPTNVHLNFSYDNRMSNDLLSEVGRILRNICSIVPGGVVCFLPSYSYENIVYEQMKKDKVLDTISRKKTVFREPKSAAEVDQVLQKFANSVKSKENNKNGALLLSVVGGKLSEGLNFSDDLGRCVIVIGMPYPNVKSAELQEKMSYLNRTARAGAGSEYYENLCMKAVNQCIGRAVRHANDYAAVLLVDERYSRQQTVAALPSFVQKSLLTNCTFGQTIGSIAKFFSRHKDKK